MRTPFSFSLSFVRYHSLNLHSTSFSFWLVPNCTSWQLISELVLSVVANL
ncbi:unnamed protein product [Linum tenue]|uniref:Uncharacterized protein n=1 Tax=Linum tenue TaxID=586396 RepID=A0AAV0HV75_9ROSI|nr:unnamed protein product [Linum tenue]